jgi:pyridoxine/pyridoxamine 5'-phosphate oxidase
MPLQRAFQLCTSRASARASKCRTHACRRTNVCVQALERKLHELQEKYRDESVAIPKPPFWGGFRVEATMIEFWHSRPSRLHDRLRFSRQGPDEAWTLQRLSP